MFLHFVYFCNNLWKTEIVYKRALKASGQERIDPKNVKQM